MSKQKKEYLNLPRKYKLREDTPKEFYDREGLPYMSYSAYTSFKNKENPEFYYQAILDYIFGIKITSRFAPFAEFGSDCGDYINPNDKDKNGLLSEEDKKFLDEFKKDFSPNSEYEKEIWIDLGNFFCLGYSDRYLEEEDGITIQDFKTGNIETKVKDYANEDKYNQTVIYAYPEDLKGKKIKDCYVTLLGRKGNPISDTNPTRMYLDGTAVKIPTPYSRERAEKTINDMKAIAKEISSLNTTYSILKNLTFQL